MQAPDEGLLDDAARLEAADPGGMLRQVASAAAQVRSAFQATAETGFRDVITGGRPRAIVVTGQGDAALAGELLAAVCGPGCPVQVTVVRGYQLPGWVSAADLVLAVSSSGATAETMAVAEQAVRRGCRLAGAGAAGSPLAGLAEQARAPFVPVRPAGTSRGTLWGMAVPLVGVAARLGLCQADEAAHEAAAAVLEDISQRCRPDSEAFVNPAKELALALAGSLPLIWGSSELAGLAARRFASQLHQNAKYPARPGVLPEAVHNQAEMFVGPFAPGEDLVVGGIDFGDGEAGDTRLRLVMLADSEERPELTQCREATVALAAGRGIKVTELAAAGGHPLTRLASLIQLTDYATVYLGLALGADPSSVAVIQELTAKIA